jgi:glutamyl-tRNA synthetase
VSAADVRGRYAPSPTGELHLGNASTALLAWLSIRARGGSFVMRIEDLDRNRSRDELADQALGDLGWLGIDWDEGPDRGGPFAPYEQWPRREHYQRAFERLKQDGRLYPCFCSRRDIATAASAPQEPGETRRYPATCRRIPADVAAARAAREERHAWRFRVEEGRAPVFEDRVRGPWGAGRSSPGDFVVYRADGVPAYQLAVVLDDAAMQIDEVVRGDDLLTSTPAQLLLYEALGLRAPVFGHVPLLLGPDGARLSKRHRGVTLRELREAGYAPETVVGRLAQRLGLRPDASPVEARDLVPGFDLSRVPSVDPGYVIDPADW